MQREFIVRVLRKRPPWEDIVPPRRHMMHATLDPDEFRAHNVPS